MSSRALVTLGDVLTLQRGVDITRAQQAAGAIPVVSSSGVNSFHNTAISQGPGVVIGRKGSLGTCFYLPGPFWPHDTTLWVKDFKGNDPRFCFYLLKSMGLGQYDVGAANPTLNRNHVHILPVWKPLLPTQRRIASILGAYDDLIEVNRRRIAALEEMPRRLFDEWFVNFRFPGHEGHEMLEMEQGLTPAGWISSTAVDAIAFDPPTRVPRDGDKPFIPMTNLSTTTSIIDPPEVRAGNSGSRFQNGDTLLARITPCLENGKTGWVRRLQSPDGIGFGSTEFIVMRGSVAGPAFTYCLARSTPFRSHAIKSMSGATGRQRVRVESLKQFPVAVPPKQILDRFEKFASPCLQTVGVLADANHRLAASRDLLLPRLISGELPLSASPARSQRSSR